MSWLRLDDTFTRHPKIQSLSDGAFRLHVEALCYCAQYLTDGFLSDAIMRREFSRSGGMVKELVSIRLWHREAGGYRIHDYLTYNPSREKVEADREADRARKKLAGERSHIRAIS